MQIKRIWIVMACVLLAGVLSAEPIPAKLKQGDVIPELVWKDRTIKTNVKIINLVAGRVILKHDDGTDQLRLEEFQKLVQLTNESLDDVRTEQAEKQKSLEEARQAQQELKNAPPAPASNNPFNIIEPPPSSPAQSSATTTPTPPSSPFGTPTPKPTPAPTLPATAPPSAPVPSPTPAVPKPAPVSSVPLSSPKPTSANPFAPSSPIATPTTPAIPAGDPQELLILRESIHGRIEQLQSQYLTSLTRLQSEFTDRGNAAAANRVNQAIERAERQKEELSRLLKDKGKSRNKGLDSRVPDRKPVPSTPVVQPRSPEVLTPPRLSGTPRIPVAPPMPVSRPAPATHVSSIPGKPEQLRNGQVPVVVDNIQAGGMSGLSMKRVEKWGPVMQERIEGRPYWTVEVDYKANSIFGDFPARAKALIERGRVVKWMSSPRS